MTRHDHQSHSVSPTLEDPNDPTSRFLEKRVGGLVNPQDMEHKFRVHELVGLYSYYSLYSYYGDI